MRVLYICRGRPGLGHLAPCLAIDRHLTTTFPNNYEGAIATYGLSLEACRQRGLAPIELKFPYAGVGYPGLPVLRGLWPALSEIVEQFQPQVLVGSGEFLLPLFRVVENVPCVLLANSRYLRTPGGYFAAIKPVLKWMHDAADHVIDYSIDGCTSAALPQNTEWLGPLVYADHKPSKSDIRRTLGVPDNRPVVLVTKGGGEEFAKEDIAGKGSRQMQEALNTKMIDTVLQFAGTKAGLEQYFIVITGFGVTHEHAVRTVAQHQLPNVLLKLFTHEVLDFMFASDVVVSRAGANMIGEAVFTSRPQILIPVDVDDEQMANASYMDSHSAAVCLRTDTIDAAGFESALSSILQDQSRAQQLVANARGLFPQIDTAVATAANRVLAFAK